MFVEEEEHGEFEDCCQIPFVGRRHEREEIKTAFKKRLCRLRQIYGFPCVGKERLTQEVTKELCQESKDKNVDLRYLNVSCSSITTWECFMCKLNNICSQESWLFPGSRIETEEQFCSAILQKLSDSEIYLLLTFSKCEDLTFDYTNQSKFVKFCNHVLKLHKNIFILVTSQAKLNFVSDAIVKYSKLGVLWPQEAKSLLIRAVHDEDLSCCAESIVKGCNYTPGLILDAVRILKHPDRLIEPQCLCSLLQSPETALETFSMKHVNPDFRLKIILDRLCKRIIKHQMQRDVFGLSLFNGSFSSKAAAAVLGYKNENEATVSALVPLSDNAVIDVIRENGRFRLNPFLRTFLLQEDIMPLTVPEQDTAKLRFVNFFGEVLQRVDSDLFANHGDRNVVPGYLHDDYENVKQLMTVAMHCNEDVFKAIMRAVKSTEEIFIHCFEMAKVKDFYEHLLKNAEKFGDAEDKAILKCLLGQTLATKKVEANTMSILRLYEEALQILRNKGSEYHLFILLGLMAQTLIRQGKPDRGLTYVDEALELKMDNFDKKKVERRKICVQSQEAIAKLFLEKNESATQLLNDTLEHAQRVAPYHPEVPVMLNSLGLICERTGDHERALYYYNFSLKERRSIAETKPEILVPTLNNIGTQLMIRGNYSAAMDRLNEALEIRKRCSWNDYFTGLTLWSIGKVQLLMLKFQVALQHFEEANEILTKCTPEHFLINEVNISMAHCYQNTGLREKAVEIYKSILTSKDHYMKHVPRGEQTAIVLHHLLNLADRENCYDIYSDLQRELHRLGDLAKIDEDHAKYLVHQRRISDCRQIFQHCLEQNIDQIHRIGAELIGKQCLFCKRLRILSTSPFVRKSIPSTFEGMKDHNVQETKCKNTVLDNDFLLKRSIPVEIEDTNYKNLKEHEREIKVLETRGLSTNFSAVLELDDTIEKAVQESEQNTKDLDTRSKHPKNQEAEVKVLETPESATKYSGSELDDTMEKAVQENCRNMKDLDTKQWVSKSTPSESEDVVEKKIEKCEWKVQIDDDHSISHNPKEETYEILYQRVIDQTVDEPKNDTSLKYQKHKKERGKEV